MLDLNKLVPMCISIFISVFIAIFLIDRLKKLAKEMCDGIAIAIRDILRLPTDTNTQSIIQVLYALGIVICAISIYVVVQPPVPSFIAFLVYACLSAVAIPIICFSLYLAITIVWEFLCILCNLAIYLVWVPRQLYKNSAHPSGDQFLMFWGWLILSCFLGVLFYTLFSIFAL